MRVVTRSSLFFTATAALFASGECMSEAVRSKKDFVNAAVGGVCAGVVPGIAAQSLAAGMRASAVLAVGMGFTSYM